MIHSHQHLLEKYVQTKLYLIGDTSGSIATDAAELRKEIEDYVSLYPGLQMPNTDWDAYFVVIK